MSLRLGHLEPEDPKSLKLKSTARLSGALLELLDTDAQEDLAAMANGGFLTLIPPMGQSSETGGFWSRKCS
jgi:hypothetical protein